MFLRRVDNFKTKKLNTDLKKNYIMGMERYPQDLPWVMKLLNNYISEIGTNRNFGKISGKEQMGVAFTQTQEKGEKGKKEKK